jgi:glycosyltransferase involved in cell wall biosynthesis
MVHACTIIARNYVAHARVLADSFFAHHDNGRFTVVLIDDESHEFDDSREVFRCLRLSDVGLDPDEINQLAAIYEVTELATAVKPRVLRHLSAAGGGPIIYLDPDIRIYGSLEDASQLAEKHSIVLTPHMTASAPRDGRRISDFHILSAGIYNLGFIGVGPGSEAFIDWWWQKTRREAFVDHARMMFTDQRWVDFVPAFFDHVILKDPSYNVAYWNLHSRHLTCDGSAYLVDGAPLTFFHFSGFDAEKPHLLSKHQGECPRILLSERPALARICREYAESLEQAGISYASHVPYGWGSLASGMPLDRRMRRLYGEGIERHEMGLASMPPNPFGNEARFMDWLNEPVGGGVRPRVSRYLNRIYQDRPDLQIHFPDLAGDDCRLFFLWARSMGVIEEHMPAELLPPDPADSTPCASFAAAGALKSGVNIAGYFRAELGVGEAARLLTSAVDAAAIPHSTLGYDVTSSRTRHPYDERGDGSLPYDINIVCVNADRMPDFARDVGRTFFAGRHTIGYWFWELEHFPRSMYAGFDCVDEVWTATEFVADSVRAVDGRPVYTMPIPVLIPRCSADVTRNSLQLPSGFMFLFIFDFFSVMERKNPIGVIQAFTRAFRPYEGPILVVKTINGHFRLNELERVRSAASHRPDIFIIDEYYSAEQKNALLGLCDCYVSLHRSEGFGLTLAEAMGLGKPVIATGYSGNLDFMNTDNSYLVDYVMSQVPADCDPYPAGRSWAEPRVEHAADYMRRVYESHEEANKLGRQAREDILTRYNVKVAGRLLRRRLDDIRQLRKPMAVANDSLSRPTTSGPQTAREAVTHPAVRAVAALIPTLTPTPSVAPGRPFRPLLLKAQEILFRILRPYWWQQRRVHEVLAEAVSATARTADQSLQAELNQKQALASVWTAIQSMQRSLAGLDQRERERLSRTGDLSVAVRQIEARLQQGPSSAERTDHREDLLER